MACLETDLKYQTGVLAPTVQVQPLPTMGLDVRSSDQISLGFGALGLVHRRTQWVCVQAPFYKLRHEAGEGEGGESLI